MLILSYFNHCANSILKTPAHFFHREHEMKTVRFRHVRPDEYSELIDMYFKLEMKSVMDKIFYAYTQGSFNTVVAA